MRHQTRLGLLGLVTGLAAYITGLQKKVLTPVFDAFGDLDTSLQLTLLAVIAAAVLVVGFVLGQRSRAKLSAARAGIDANFG